MNKHNIVIDTNVFLEILLNRQYRKKVETLLKEASKENVSLFVPSVFLDEVSEILAIKCKLSDVQKCQVDLDELIDSKIISVVIPSSRVRLKAIEIFLSGNEKTGFPGYIDSLFHALALDIDGIFVTNDKKHFKKSFNFGNIILLEEFIPQSSHPL